MAKLTPEQRNRVQQVRKNQGSQAAQELRQRLMDRKADGGKSTAKKEGARGGNKSSVKRKVSRTDPVTGEQTSTKASKGDIKTITQGVDPAAGAAVAGDILSFGETLGRNISPELFEEAGLGRTELTRTAEQQSILDNAQAQLEASGQASPELQALINRRMQAVEQGGFTNQQREALAFQGQQDIDVGLQTALRQAQALNMQAGRAGGVARQQFSPAMMQAIRSQQGLTADLRAREIAQLNEQMAAAQGAVSNRDARLFAQQQQALGQFGGLTERAQLMDQDIRRFNLGQRAKEIAGRVQARGVGQGLVEQQLQTGRSNTAFQQLQEAERERAQQVQDLL